MTGTIQKDGKLHINCMGLLDQWSFEHKNKAVKISFEIRRKKRSNPQNAYYWGVCIPLIQEGIKELGTEMSAEEAHEFLKCRFNYVRVVVNQEEVLDLPISTAKLTTVDFMLYLDKVAQFAAEYLGIVIPKPNEQTTIDYYLKSANK